VGTWDYLHNQRKGLRSQRERQLSDEEIRWNTEMIDWERRNPPGATGIEGASGPPMAARSGLRLTELPSEADRTRAQAEQSGDPHHTIVISDSDSPREADHYKPEPERARQEHMEAERRQLLSQAPRGSATRATTVSATMKHSEEPIERGKLLKRQAEQTTNARIAARAKAAFPLRAKVGQTAEQSKGYKSIAKLPPEEAAVVEQSKPKRLPPFVLSSPHEAIPVLHKDWTLVDGAAWDPDKFVLELRLRGERNKMIHEYLEGGFPVWYPSSGNSMWPLVQSHDFCTFHPIEAATADAGPGCVVKEASTVQNGDVVFCLVQPQHQYYARIVIHAEWDYHRLQHKYWIGGIRQNINVYCFREHIFGILVDAQVQYNDNYDSRPRPKTLCDRAAPMYHTHPSESVSACLLRDMIGGSDDKATEGMTLYVEARVAVDVRAVAAAAASPQQASQGGFAAGVGAAGGTRRAARDPDSIASSRGKGLQVPSASPPEIRACEIQTASPSPAKVHPASASSLPPGSVGDGGAARGPCGVNVKVKVMANDTISAEGVNGGGIGKGNNDTFSFITDRLGLNLSRGGPPTDAVEGRAGCGDGGDKASGVRSPRAFAGVDGGSAFQFAKVACFDDNGKRVTAPARRRMRSRSRETRLKMMWEGAREGARQVLSDCRGIQSMFVHQPLIDIDVGLVMNRARHLHDRAVASGRSVYIGTTSVEKHVIAHFPRADNKVASQQGLAVRHCAYSFLYVCRHFLQRLQDKTAWCSTIMNTVELHSSYVQKREDDEADEWRSTKKAKLKDEKMDEILALLRAQGQTFAALLRAQGNLQKKVEELDQKVEELKQKDKQQALTKRISVGSGANLVATAAMLQSLAIALITELNEKRVFILPGVGTFSVKSSPARDRYMMKGEAFVLEVEDRAT
ncbi:unnamed protein product, partial [Prorocentrum cordatum]